MLQKNNTLPFPIFSKKRIITSVDFLKPKEQEMRTFVSLAAPNDGYDIHTVKPNKWRTLTVAQVQNASAKIQAVPGVIGCLIEVRDRHIRVSLPRALNERKRARVLKGVLAALAKLGLHDPTGGVETPLPYLS